MSCDHHVNRVVTITETESHDLSAKEAWAAANQCRGGFCTTCWDARGDFVTAAGARIFNAPCDCNRWWLAAYGLAANGLAANGLAANGLAAI